MKTVQELVADAKSAAHCLTPDGAKAMIAEEQDPLLLDVREPMEVAQQRVVGFTNIPRGVLEMKIAEVCPQWDRAIFIHCATGGRAALSAQQLAKMGYQRVYVIDCACDTLVNVMGQVSDNG